MDYWDTSALAKLYVNEPDSALFTGRVASSSPVTTSELARWEIFRVLARKELERQISAGAAQIIFQRFLADVSVGSIVLVPMSGAVENHFRQLIEKLHRLSPPLMTRTLDGVHLATAILNQAVDVIASDGNLRKCALAMGIKVFPP